MLQQDNTVLIVIDVQGKLAGLMHNKEALFENVAMMIKGARALNLPIVWTEQHPDGLGPTLPEIAELMPGIKPISKVTFSCCGTDAFVDMLQTLKRNQVLLTGIETHVCVYQTAMDMLGTGYEVQVVADAVSSRNPENKHIGLEKMKAAGAGITSTEIALFELLKVAQGEAFKKVLRIVK